MVLCAVLLFASCAKIPINNDPVIGIWINTVENSSSDKSGIQTEYEWIFNDAYLGRHHQYEGKTLTLQTDFSWNKQNGVYTISYPGTDLPNDVVKLIATTTLQSPEGKILAIRE
tara:strand:+ start:24461 stop:24802 length:342 start_codon:yes stop_codon:yes gene_type:complete